MTIWALSEEPSNLGIYEKLSKAQQQCDTGPLARAMFSFWTGILDLRVEILLSETVLLQSLQFAGNVRGKHLLKQQ